MGLNPSELLDKEEAAVDLEGWVRNVTFSPFEQFELFHFMTVM